MPKNCISKKIYQLIISRLNGDSISSPAYRNKIIELVRKGIGGFIIFGGFKDDIKDFIKELQIIAETPLFIASDIERGVGQQIRGTTGFPCQMAVAAAIDKKNPEDILILQEMLNAVAAEAIDIGINMPLIPVLDVNQNPDNPIICTRAFSDAPEDTTWFGSKYIKTLESSGLISCAKHFPGHGDTAMDSHIALPVINKPDDAIRKVDILPFAEAIKSGVSSIMIGHLSVPSLDVQPASVSRKIINGLLRNELCFEGLILTDALNMHAIKSIKNIHTECLKAGADLLLHPDDADSAVDEIRHALDTGDISEDIIDAALSRILKVKGRLHRIHRIGSPEADYLSNKKISEHVTDLSVSLIKTKPDLLLLKNMGIANLVFAGDKQLYENSILRNYFKLLSISHCKNGKLKFIICAIFTSVSAWKGSSKIDREEIERINNIIGMSENSIVLSFGSPYVLPYFGKADILIAAYEATEQAQMAVIKGLTGKISFKGRIPVKLEF
jgi:beta-glucosidase-like glycosyl hydrolase